MLWESVVEHGFQWNLTFDLEYGVGLWQVGSMYYLNSVNSLSKASLLLVSYPQQKHQVFFFKVQGKKSAHWSSDFRRYQTSKLQFHICCFKIQNESPPRPARKVVVRCEAVEGRHKEKWDADRIWWGRTLKSRRMRSMKVWRWRSQKMSFIYNDEERIFLLEEEKKKSGGKRKFLWFLVFWRILFIPLFFFFFSFSKIHW